MKRALFVALAAGAVGCSGADAGTNVASEAPPDEVWLTPDQVKDAHIEMEPLADRPVGGVLRAAGRVTFDDLRVAHVFSPVTGRITKILAQPGQRVRKGQVLCILQSPDLGTAISDLAKAQAMLFQTEKDLKRQKELFEAHAASQRDVEAAEAAYLSAKAEMERAQRKAKLLRDAGLNTVTQEYELPSPIDGEVIMRGANPGLEVQGQYSGGATVELFTIGELDKVWVIADVFEMDLPRVQKGNRVVVNVLAYSRRPSRDDPLHRPRTSGTVALDRCPSRRCWRRRRRLRTSSRRAPWRTVPTPSAASAPSPTVGAQSTMRVSAALGRDCRRL